MLDSIRSRSTSIRPCGAVDHRAHVGEPCLGSAQSVEDGLAVGERLNGRFRFGEGGVGLPPGLVDGLDRFGSARVGAIARYQHLAPENTGKRRDREH
ncbi:MULTISPECIES: hypothetical protein [unclassified Bradyrhizobium]|uniref:hypothetical protein n=1 Tax=unclassified Bradyrhizobium TaxID=2631580 RepID=UPI0028E85CCD|nr:MULTISPECIES: hypothetical protein [unclassified Bradyrhizobium]